MEQPADAVAVAAGQAVLLEVAPAVKAMREPPGKAVVTEAVVAERQRQPRQM